MPQLRTDIRSLYKHEDIRPEAIIDSLYELHEHKSESAKLQLDLFGDLEETEDDELERREVYVTSMLPLKIRPNIAESLCTKVFPETMLGLDLISRKEGLQDDDT